MAASMTGDHDPGLSTPEAARYLGVAPNTLEIWRSTGRYDLPFEKVGRKVRYRKSALDHWRAGRTWVSTGGSVRGERAA